MLSTDKIKTPTLSEAIDETFPVQDDYYDNVELPERSREDDFRAEAYQANSD